MTGDRSRLPLFLISRTVTICERQQAERDVCCESGQDAVSRWRPDVSAVERVIGISECNLPYGVVDDGPLRRDIGTDALGCPPVGVVA
jgi:hypothetical protein